MAGRARNRLDVGRRRKDRGGDGAAVYRRILVPLADAKESERAIEIACRLAAEHRAALTVLTVIEVPVVVPMDAFMVEEEAEAKRALDLARAIADGYGVRVSVRVVRARGAGEAIISEAGRASTELIVLWALRKRRSRGSTHLFGETVDFVLKHARCRVMVAVARPGT
jgi:basic amino acid/polyamine antiporter, APA family